MKNQIQNIELLRVENNSIRDDKAHRVVDILNETTNRQKTDSGKSMPEVNIHISDFTGMEEFNAEEKI